MEKIINHLLVQKVLNVLPTSAELFVVGGAVRDCLLGRPITDIDLVVRNLQISELRSTLKTLGEVDTSGEKWGVLSLVLDGQRIDIALPREEIQKKGDGHYFDTQVTADPSLPIATDLRRRDFTINAMALNIQSGELVDPFHGQVDVKHKTLRTVGNPHTRFTQDHSRILRCLRLATQLRFAIEPITWEGLRTVVQQVGHLNVPKRIWEQEFAKAQIDLPAFHEWLRKAGIETHHVDA